MIKLSNKAWHKANDVFEAIICHPFNQELMCGILDREKFAYYIEQDAVYLQALARCHALIASKISTPLIKNFLKHAESALICEQEVVHEFFRKTFDFKETDHLSPATLSYTSYLLATCSLESVEVGIASVLPCFWVYREVGMHIAKYSAKQNPYARWIETYASTEFNDAVNEVINIFDQLSLTASNNIRNKMVDAFYKSACLEWHFWNDAYNQVRFNPI